MYFLKLCSIFLLIFEGNEGTTFLRSVDLDPKYKLHWNVENDEIIFKAEVEYNGWIGFGFSPSGKMKGSDTFMFYMLDGKTNIIDGHVSSDGNPHQQPTTDANNDYSLVEGNKNDTHVWAIVKRKLNTCDKQDRVLTADRTTLIWAYGKVENAQLSRHFSRGSTSVYLLNRRPSKTLLSQENTFEIELKLSKKVSIPNTGEPFYWCEIFEMNNAEHKNSHLIGYEVQSSKHNQQYLHQVTIHRCRKDMSEYIGKPGRCFIGNSWNKTNNPISNCGQEYIGTWTYGGEPYVFPENVGQPIFGNDGKTFIMLEIHYDNTMRDPGVKDQSSVMLYLSKTARKFESGSMMLGAFFGNSMLIPPKQEKFTTYSFCPSGCTNKLDESISVFAANFHTHLLGRGVRLRHVRNGKELQPIFVDDQYGYNYQTMMILEVPVVIQKGDQLIVECIYSSAARTRATLGGYTLEEETCMLFLEYFPRRSNGVEYCSSGPDTTQIYKTLGATSYNQIQPNKPISTGVGEQMSVATFVDQNVQWTQETVDRLQNLVKTGPHMVFCTIGTVPRHDGEFTPTVIQLDKPPELDEKTFAEGKNPCEKASTDSPPATTAEKINDVTQKQNNQQETTTQGSYRIILDCLSLIVVMFSNFI